MLMAFKMTGVLKRSLQSRLLSSIGSPRKRTVESTSEFKHFMLFQIWHKPTTRLWIMLLTDTNSFRLWKDEKVCTRQCLLHYLLPCITSIIKNAAMVSEEWKNRNTVIQNWTEKWNSLVLVHSTRVQDCGLHVHQLTLQGRALALRGQNRLEGTSARSQEGQTEENSRCVQATTDTSGLQANN